MTAIGQIAEIWRYPVSSIGGERLDNAHLDHGGLAGDRQYALIDRASRLPAAPEKDKKWRKMLHLKAMCAAGKRPTITFPNNDSCSLDGPSVNDALSDYFGFAVSVAVYERDDGHFGFPLAQHRNHHFPLHVLTTASLQRLAELRQIETIDSRRFRPTVLIDTRSGIGFLEKEWIGRGMRLGAVELIAQEETKRCGMTFISQPGIDEDPEILRNILRHNKRSLGIYCSVENVGTIHVGDKLVMEN